MRGGLSKGWVGVSKTVLHHTPQDFTVKLVDETVESDDEYTSRFAPHVTSSLWT